MPPLFLSERHPVSHKAAILADEGTSVWLYMTDSGSDYPVADCWLLNTVPSPEHLNGYRGDSAPPAILKFVVPGSEGDAPLESDIELRWAPDGHSVALLVKGTPLGFIAQGNKHGYSKNLVTASPFGMPFEQELYERLFP
ncbi:hypothetical protein [Aeromonas hydrophila]|uniref:hypothetical protein n=1 Tax=Aeromonas hydrophila TaxID=644 RepID=UPI003D1E8C27